MKRSLLGSVVRALFPRAYLSAYPYGRTFGPSPGQQRSTPEKFIMNDLTVGAYYKFSESDNYKQTVLDFSNYLYLESLNIQERFENHFQKKSKLASYPIFGIFTEPISSFVYSKLQRQLKQFQDDLDELTQQISTIAKVTFSNREPSKLPIACATNILYLLGMKTSMNRKDSENLNMSYSFCLKLIEEKIDNIHLEGIAQSIWGLSKLLERGGQVADLVRGPSGQRIIDKLLKRLEGRAFGDEIRYVDKVGLSLETYVASSEYLSNRSDISINFLNGKRNLKLENWSAFILIEGLRELKEKGGFDIDANLIASLKARRGDLDGEIVEKLRSSQSHIIPRQLQGLQISQQ